jgi:hypothetical protein
MKRRKRAFTGSNLPVITKRPAGKWAVEVAEGCFIKWWCERRNDQARWYVQLETPVDVPIDEVRDRAFVTRPARQ